MERTTDKTATERTEEIAYMINDLGGLPYEEFRREIRKVLSALLQRIDELDYSFEQLGKMEPV